MIMTVAVDFDGTLSKGGQLLQEALTGVRELHASGVRLILWSCRCNPCDDAPTLPDEEQRFYSYGEVPDRVRAQWDWFNEMRTALKAAGVWDLFSIVWQAPGKPVADIYVDDLAEAPRWPALVKSLTGGIS
jgi:hypothetical protein